MPVDIFKFLEFIGYGACHRRLNLSFNYMQYHMPVCSRCTGIYVGLVLSAALILLSERRIKTQFPGRKITAAAVILFAVMAVESRLSLLKIIPAYNAARFLTGYSVGWFIPLFLIPLLNSVVFRSGICIQEQYLKKARHFVIWIILGLALGLIFLMTYKQAILFWSIASVTGLIMLLTVLAMTLVFAVNPKLTNTIQKLFSFLIFFLPAMAVSLAFISLSSYLKSIVNPQLYYAYEYLKSVFS